MALSWSAEEPLEVSTWTELPREVMEIVMKNISHHDLWTCRKISSCWAAAAKASGLLKLVTSLSCSAWNEVPVKLSRLQHLQIYNSQVQCCLKVELHDTATCATMLEPLADQGVQLPKCRLLVALSHQEGSECDLAADIRSIAEASVRLQQKGVELCIQLKPSSADHSLPPPQVLAQMAPVIQRVKCSKLKTAWCLSEAFKRKPCFSAAHILALSNAGTSLQELCISDYSVRDRDDIMPNASMASIATFSCLTRLDLVCCGSPALQALGQLSHLQKLGLRLRHEGLARETCCEAVLLSNKAGLRKVHLDGCAWSDATYLALLTLTSLKVLTLTVSTISSPSANVLGDIVATKRISIWFQESHSVANCALQGLTSSCASITAMRLDFMFSAQFQHVCTMEHLSSPTIFRPNSFTGFELAKQPNLSRLDLVNCHDLDTESLRHIVHLFPDLTRIGTVSAPLAPWPKVCVDSFVEISKLRKLELVDLSGLDTIPADQAEALECAIRAQQELGLMQPEVRLGLPILHNGTCIQLRIGSSHHQVFSGTAPGEQLELAIDRHWVQQHGTSLCIAKAGAKLTLRGYMTALVKAASRIVVKLLRLQ